MNSKVNEINAQTFLLIPFLSLLLTINPQEKVVINPGDYFFLSTNILLKMKSWRTQILTVCLQM